MAQVHFQYRLKAATIFIKKKLIIDVILLISMWPIVLVDFWYIFLFYLILLSLIETAGKLPACAFCVHSIFQSI